MNVPDVKCREELKYIGYQRLWNGNVYGICHTHTHRRRKRKGREGGKMGRERERKVK